MNTYDFTGRVALVTGGASGIGAAAAERLRAEGAQVAMLDLDLGKASRDALAIRGDVTRSAEVDAAVARVESELGRLDVLVCCAGISGESRLSEEVADETWERVLAVNAGGTFYACRAVIPGMRRRGYGRIVNIASVAGKEGVPLSGPYSASKAAVIALTKSLGRELAGTGILVNCVAPGIVDTPLLGGLSEEHKGYVIQRVPLGRMGQPEEVASLIAYLASEELSYATGACFDVSGGRAAY